MPAASAASRGAARAHRPNAPSTCTQAPAACALRDDLGNGIEGAGVHVAGLQAQDGRPADGAAVHRRACAPGRPPARASRDCGPDRARPVPSARSGGPPRPTMHGDGRRAEQAVGFDDSSRQRASTRWRAAASAVMFAIVAPVTNGAGACRAAGRSTSSSQRSASCSMCATPGVTASRQAFWSQAVASQLAASVTGSAAADDEAEEARPGHRHRGGRDDFVELCQHRARIAAALPAAAPEPRQARPPPPDGCHGAFRAARPGSAARAGRVGQQLLDRRVLVVAVEPSSSRHLWIGFAGSGRTITVSTTGSTSLAFTPTLSACGGSPRVRALVDAGGGQRAVRLANHVRADPAHIVCHGVAHLGGTGGSGGRSCGCAPGIAAKNDESLHFRVSCF